MANPYRLPICARVIAGVFTTHAAVSSHRGGLGATIVRRGQKQKLKHGN